jgi:hypothetical protein
VEEQDAAAAVRLCGGELLPCSDAPAIRMERDDLSARLRRLVLDRGGAEELWTYAQNEPGRSDVEVLDRLRAVLPPRDSRRATVAWRRARVFDGA